MYNILNFKKKKKEKYLNHHYSSYYAKVSVKLLFTLSSAFSY